MLNNCHSDHYYYYILQWLSISSFLHLDEDRTFDGCFQIKADNVPETDESFFVNLTSVTSLPFDGDLGMYTLHEFTYFNPLDTGYFFSHCQPRPEYFGHTT